MVSCEGSGALAARLKPYEKAMEKHGGEIDNMQTVERPVTIMKQHIHARLQNKLEARITSIKTALAKATEDVDKLPGVQSDDKNTLT